MASQAGDQAFSTWPVGTFQIQMLTMRKSSPSEQPPTKSTPALLPAHTFSGSLPVTLEEETLTTLSPLPLAGSPSS
jgi:hypothetical protein